MMLIVRISGYEISYGREKMKTALNKSGVLVSLFFIMFLGIMTSGCSIDAVYAYHHPAVVCAPRPRHVVYESHRVRHGRRVYRRKIVHRRRHHCRRKDFTVICVE